MKKIFCMTLTLLLACLVLPACAADQTDAAETGSAAAGDDDANTFYAIGLMLATNLKPLGLSADELKEIQAGLSDGAMGNDPRVELGEYQAKIQTLAVERAQQAAELEKGEAVKYLAAEAAKGGATTTESGIVIAEMTAGAGESPAATDRVKVHYHGTLRDGTVFDSSVDRGSPATFGLNQVVPCWTEAIQTMKVGGKSRITCPSDLAYGERGAPPTIPPNAALTFEVELLEIVKPEPPPEPATPSGSDTDG